MVQSAAIGIMCKAPRPGHTKTRLAAQIGAAAAARLSACFLRDLAAAIECVPERLGRTGYGVYAPAGSEAELSRLFPPTFKLLLQVDAEFGNVLHGATDALLAAGHDCVVLVNGDSPTLPPALLVEAIEALRHDGDRMVLGRASDGGYYLVGLKHAHRRLFEDIAWGTSVVAEQTLERAREIGLESTMLAEWYDVDDGETLNWLHEEFAGRSAHFHNGGAAPATRACLAELGFGAKSPERLPF
jgi:rSAM/selenodomain-associated transferase 1